MTNIWPQCPTGTNKERHTSPFHGFAYIWNVKNNILRSLLLAYDVCPKSNENDLKKKLLNLQEITVFPLQNRLLVIEYSDSSVAATLHSSAETLHLICCSKPSSQLPGRFQLSQNDVLWGGFWAWKKKKISRNQVRAVRWVGKSCDIMLSQKFPHSEWCVTWCVVMLKEPRVCNFTADAQNSVS